MSPASSPRKMTALAGALLGAAIGGAVALVGSIFFLGIYIPLAVPDELGPRNFVFGSILYGLLLGCLSGLLLDAGRRLKRAYEKDACRRGAGARFRFGATAWKPLLVIALVAPMLCFFVFLLFGGLPCL